MNTDTKYLTDLLNGFLKGAEGLDYVARYRSFIICLLMILTKSDKPRTFTDKDIISLGPVLSMFIRFHYAKVEELMGKDKDIIQQMSGTYNWKARKERCKVCNLWNFKCNRVCNACKNTYYCCVDHQKSDWQKHKLVCAYRKKERENRPKIPFDNPKNIEEVYKIVKETAPNTEIQRLVMPDDPEISDEEILNKKY